ncbi:universal stress protein [Mesorhizobium sp. L-8-10]|uniref:universal stress protein n=1 Tax=Mesorhizobium sp. L-8-10 TaxID=2744523 RepID=UPI001925FF86|nr:universal stress protein [Mesorhizobium sp. L-8-10]BCH33917.1 universal stress protein [Mesorhizobium sp. L-8-10]
MYERILITTDGSELAQKGLRHGLALAKRIGAKVTIVTVTDPVPIDGTATLTGHIPVPIDIDQYEAGRKEFADRILAAAKADADKAGVEAATLHIPGRFAADAIVEAAPRIGAGLIVMASHGRRGLGRLLLGSQTLEVLTHSTVPVLVVR